MPRQIYTEIRSLGRKYEARLNRKALQVTSNERFNFFGHERNQDQAFRLDVLWSPHHHLVSCLILSNPSTEIKNGFAFRKQECSPRHQPIEAERRPISILEIPGADGTYSRIWFIAPSAWSRYESTRPYSSRSAAP